MTLLELRTMVRDLIFDKAPTADPFDTAALDRLINSAMHQVWNVARSLQRSLFVVDQAISVAGASTLTTPVTLAAPYTRVKRGIAAWRTGTAAGPLAIGNLAQRGLDLDAATARQPALLVVNEALIVMNPPAAPATLTAQVWYIAGLPDMTHDTNTPGQTGSGNTGTANFLPIEYHAMVALKAAVRALKAERGEWNGLQAEVEEERQALIMALQGQEQTAEDG